MYIPCLQNQKLAHLIIDVVWSEYLDRFQIAIEVDLALLQHLADLHFCLLSELLNLDVKFFLRLCIDHFVDPCLINETLRPRD
jgi:hypothetical protein